MLLERGVDRLGRVVEQPAQHVQRDGVRLSAAGGGGAGGGGWRVRVGAKWRRRRQLVVAGGRACAGSRSCAIAAAGSRAADAAPAARAEGMVQRLGRHAQQGGGQARRGHLVRRGGRRRAGSRVATAASAPHRALLPAAMPTAGGRLAAPRTVSSVGAPNEARGAGLGQVRSPGAGRSRAAREAPQPSRWPPRR